MDRLAIREQQLTVGEHTTAYLSAGDPTGPVVIFTHGWPELSLSWRHQLPFMASLGFHAIAPDMRGYGRSTVYDRHEDYRLERSVADMIQLADHLEADRVLWVGHDWGSPVAWSVANHHPDRCHGIASLCVPYGLERGLEFLVRHIDREVYPESEFPYGQWEYMKHYEEDFAGATAPMDRNPRTLIQAIFRSGDPAGYQQPSMTAFTRINGGWFGELPEAPEVPIDENVISAEELDVYARHLTRNGMFGPNSWYMNHAANAAYFESAVNDGRIDLPALFIGARYDYTCETVTSSLAEPMRASCSRLTEEIINSGHWMAQEKPVEVNRALARWLVQGLPELLQ